MLYFTANPATLPEAPGLTMIVPKIGVPVYVESVDAAPAELQIENLEVKRTGPDRVRVSLTTTNVGERIIRPPVTVEIAGTDDSFYEVFEPNAGVSPVLPHRARQWSFDLGPVPPGPLEVSLTFSTSRRDAFRETYRVSSWIPTEPVASDPDS